MSAPTKLPGRGESPLRARLAAACDESGRCQSALTVLSSRRDPYRLDTPALHRAGAWVAEQIARLAVRTPIHARGLFYVLVAAADVIKPNGSAFINTEENWVWLQENALKCARWLGYVPFEHIKDERNRAPEIYVPGLPCKPHVALSFGLEVSLPEDLCTGARDRCLRGPPALPPGAARRENVAGGRASSDRAGVRRHADARRRRIQRYAHLRAARISAEDGRPTAVLYFADCDPAGYQMSVGVARKLQALQDLRFPNLDITLYRVALTVEQVSRYGLPSTPLKETERRADRWRAAFGVEQTEIDALAALRPDLLRELAEEAIAPFHDRTLEERCEDAREAYIERAQVAFAERADTEAIALLRGKGEEYLAEIREKIEELQTEMAVAVDVGDLGLPDPIVPEPQIDRLPEPPEPLFASCWDWVDATERLRERKRYGDDSGS